MDEIKSPGPSYYEPPDDRAYCPHCHAPWEDAQEVDDEDGDGKWLCLQCDERYDEPVSRREMLADEKEDVAIARAEARMDEDA